ncbi:hypothetical protein [Streptomyces sp. NPDC007264]|uniref:hypothetical protein n=1 Tax=Streptomyces sp. NPDC007264 TaxID=3364777 RepID=UPI0036DEBA35
MTGDDGTSEDRSPGSAPADDGPRYEPAPAMGRLMLGLLIFVLAALAVVLGGVYLT